MNITCNCLLSSVSWGYKWVVTRWVLLTKNSFNKSWKISEPDWSMDSFNSDNATLYFSPSVGFLSYICIYLLKEENINPIPLDPHDSPASRNWNSSVFNEADISLGVNPFSEASFMVSITRFSTYRNIFFAKII